MQDEVRMSMEVKQIMWAFQVIVRPWACSPSETGDCQKVWTQSELSDLT